MGTSLPAFHGFLMLGLIVVCGFTISTSDVSAASYDVDLDYKDASNIKESRGRDPVQFNYTITHTGEVLSEDVFIQTYDVPSGWHVIFTAATDVSVHTGTYKHDVSMKLLIAKGERASLSITITPSIDTKPGVYWMTLDVWPEKDRGQIDSHRFAVIIDQYAGSEVVLVDPPPSNVFLATPRTTVSMRFALYNTGNGDDAFHMNVQTLGTNDDWNYSDVVGIDAQGHTPTLASDPVKASPHYIDVLVPTPEGTRGGDTISITVIARSLFDPDSEPSIASAGILVPQRYGLGVDFRFPEGDMFRPGDQIVISAVIENQGNGWDRFEVTAESMNPMGGTFEFSIEPSRIELDYNGTGTGTIIIDVPDDADEGTYVLTISVASWFSKVVSKMTEFRFEVGFPDLVIPSMPTYIHPDEGPVVLPFLVVGPDEMVTFELQVENHGTVEATDASLILWMKDKASTSDMGVAVLEVTMPTIEPGLTLILGGLDPDTSLNWSFDESGVYVLEFLLTYPFRMKAVDDISSVIVMVNMPPVVKIDDVDLKVLGGVTHEVSGTVTDDHDEVEWIRYRIDMGPWEEVNETSDWSIFIPGPELAAGQHRLDVLAYDGYEESQLESASFEVVEQFQVKNTPWFILLAVLLIILAIPVVVLRSRKA